MKIVAPVSSVDEVEMLIACGADELYCGFTPAQWHELSKGLWWLNRRDPRSSDFSSRNSLVMTIHRAHQAGVPVYVAVNAPWYHARALSYVVELCSTLVEDCGADGLIVADLNLLLLLKEYDLKGNIHLSNLGSCYNSKSAMWFASLGVERIIISRHMRRSEIARLVHRSPKQIQFEVFALNDGCYFEEAYCQVSHNLGSFCLSDWAGAMPCWLSESHLGLDLDKERAAVGRYLWYLNNCGSSFQAQGLPNGPCSLCWFGYFRDWGISAVKIAGREASFHRKMASLQLVKAVMDLVRQGASHEEIGETARSLRATPEFCQSGYMCYYGDA